MRAALLFVLTLSSLPTLAWDTLFYTSSDLSLRGSSETSTATTREEHRAEREAAREAERQRRAQQERRQPAGAQCRDDADCLGWCRSFVCVDQNVPQQPAPQQPMPPPAGGACQTYEQCGPTESCVNGQCMAPPPPSVRRQGVELLLRQRVAQLREDLTLGRGPTIDALAVVEGVDARVLGAAMRARRAELTALVGDARDPAWAHRFLLRVDALVDVVALNDRLRSVRACPERSRGAESRTD